MDFLATESYEFLIYLDINTLSDRWFANIFSHLVGCLSILLTVSFAAQKLSIFFFSLFIYFERERASGGEGWQREREGERDRIPSRLHTVSAEPDIGPELMNHEIMT